MNFKRLMGKIKDSYIPNGAYPVITPIGGGMMRSLANYTSKAKEFGGTKGKELYMRDLILSAKNAQDLVDKLNNDPYVYGKWYVNPKTNIVEGDQFGNTCQITWLNPKK